MAASVRFRDDNGCHCAGKERRASTKTNAIPPSNSLHKRLRILGAGCRPHGNGCQLSKRAIVLADRQAV